MNRYVSTRWATACAALLGASVISLTKGDVWLFVFALGLALIAGVLDAFATDGYEVRFTAHRKARKF